MPPKTRDRAPFLPSDGAARPRFRWRPVGVALAAAMLSTSAANPRVPETPPSSASALAEVLRGRGLLASPEDVTWLDGPHGLEGATVGEARALVRASTKDEPADLYIVTTRLSPEGVLLDVLASTTSRGRAGSTKAARSFAGTTRRTRPRLVTPSPASTPWTSAAATRPATRSGAASSGGRPSSPISSKRGRRRGSCMTRSPSTRRHGVQTSRGARRACST
jgi:hypothetical protein